MLEPPMKGICVRVNKEVDLMKNKCSNYSTLGPSGALSSSVLLIRRVTYLQMQALQSSFRYKITLAIIRRG